MKDAPKEWDAWVHSPEPFLQPLPKSFKTEITLFEKLLLVRILKEEKTLYAMTYYVEQTLGKKYAANTAAIMEEVYKDTDYKTPLIFILS